MLNQKRGEADRFVTKLLAHEFLAARRLVAFIEKQVERLQHCVQAPRQLLPGGNLERDARIADLLLGPGQSLGDGRIRREERLRNFPDAESAKRLERERCL